MGGGEVLKKGWLIKSPPLEGGGIKAWRKRWFCLRTSKVMEYFKGEDGDLKGVVNLEDCKAVHSDLEHKKYKYVFDIETKDRTYYLVASSSEEMKSWVDTICTVCGFNVQLSAEVEDQPASSRSSMTLPANLSNPNISAPTSAVGTMPLNERFKPSQNGQMSDDLYSLATAAGQEVQKQLSGGDQEVPSGTPLADALAHKGLGNSVYSTATASTYDQAVNRTRKLSGSSYFAPHQGNSATLPGQASDSIYSLYASGPIRPPVSTLAPVPKPRSATINPLMDDSSSYHKPLGISQSLGGDRSPSSSAGPTVGSLNTRMGFGGRAEELENGYMRPRPINRVPNYDYLPFGTPRPANTAEAPKEHRSALLKIDSSPPSSAPTGLNPSYVNIQRVDPPPPPIDRSNKPTPPVIDRSSKPRAVPERPHSSSMIPGGTSPSSSTSSESPPDFPARSESLSTPLESTDRLRVAMSESDIPKPTHRTTQYTQVQFDPSSKRVMIKEDQEGGGSDPIAVRGPIPVPRKRVNYSNVDLNATSLLARSKQVTLREAEAQHLQEKPYVNVDREGIPEDDTDPDYYTHMRNFSIEDADRPEYVDAIYALAQEQNAKSTDNGGT